MNFYKKAIDIGLHNLPIYQRTLISILTYHLPMIENVLKITVNRILGDNELKDLEGEESEEVRMEIIAAMTEDIIDQRNNLISELEKNFVSHLTKEEILKLKEIIKEKVNKMIENAADRIRGYSL
jgi:Ser-tRNA(Ala) deacylase AlaX